MISKCIKFGIVVLCLVIDVAGVQDALLSLTCNRWSLAEAASLRDDKPLPDQDGVLEFTVGLNVIPQTPTTYERTTVMIDASYPVETVELFDETRGIRGSVGNRSMTLESIFGPKTGLPGRITVRATVRVRGQPGEKILRRTVEFRNVAPEIWTRAEQSGSINLMVQLDVPVKSELDLTAEERELQRTKIKQAQNQLLTALEGTDFKLIRRFDVMPGCTLELKPAALSVLDRLPFVLKVSDEEGTVILKRVP